MNGISGCIAEDKDKERNDVNFYSTGVMVPNCYSSFPLGKAGKADYKDGGPGVMVEAATKDKKAVGPFSWTYTWKAVTNKKTEGEWCYMRTYLPKFHLGGLALSYKSNINTKFALRVKS